MVNEAFFFDNCSPDELALLGICSMPETPGSGGVGVLFCHAFSEERQKSYRSTFLFAKKLASEGIPSMRFDYGGTGDSEGDMADITLETMADDIICAFGEARRRLGVEKIALLGIRLGAAVAIRAASRLSGIEALVLWNPVVEGKRYFRDMMRTEKIIRLGSPVLENDAMLVPQGHFEVDAEYISPIMTEQLRSIDLAGAELPAAKCLITGRENDKIEQEQVPRLAAQLRGAGAEVECWVHEERDYWSSDSMYDEFFPEKTFDVTLAYLHGLSK